MCCKAPTKAPHSMPLFDADPRFDGERPRGQIREGEVVGHVDTVLLLGVAVEQGALGRPASNAIGPTTFAASLPMCGSTTPSLILLAAQRH